MKRAKKIISIAMAAVMMSAMVSSCGSKNADNAIQGNSDALKWANDNNWSFYDDKSDWAYKNADYKICGQSYLKLMEIDPSNGTMENMISGIDVVNGADRQISEIKSVGIGCPGTVDNKNGIVAYACNLRMQNTELGVMLEKKLGKPVNLENDANAAALGEYAVNGDNDDSFVLITLGTGVGGGVIIDGKPYRGFNCAGGELGHIIINAEGEEQCSCGNKGC